MQIRAEEDTSKAGACGPQQDSQANLELIDTNQIPKNYKEIAVSRASFIISVNEF